MPEFFRTLFPRASATGASLVGAGLSFAKEKAREEQAVASDHGVAKLHQPDERWQREQPRARCVAKLPEDKERRSPRLEHLTLGGDDVDRAGAGLPQRGGERGVLGFLVGAKREGPRFFSPAPGDDSLSKASIAVPEHQVPVGIGRVGVLAAHLRSPHMDASCTMTQPRGCSWRTTSEWPLLSG